MRTYLSIVAAMLLQITLNAAGFSIHGNRVDSLLTSPRVRHVVAATCLVGTGAVGLGAYYHRNINMPIKDYMADIRQDLYIHADDVLQYIPLASSLLLCLDKDKREGWQDRVVLAATSAAITGIIVNSVKYSVGAMRPDGSRRNSFPSGHTAFAFMGAELVRVEYGGWWGVAAYTVAIATGALRMYNEKHWSNDVLGGAGVGILSARLACWLLPWEKRKLGKCSFLPYFAPSAMEGNSAGLAFTYTF